jgi:hypothetical protein
MARCVVPVVVLVALVGGYVLGQQPTKGPDSPRTHWIGNVDPAAARWLVGKTATPTVGQVGRYAAAGADHLLDTTDGTFYRLDGDRWRVLATIVPGEARAEAAIPQSGDGILESIDAKIGEHRQNAARVEAAMQNVTTESNRKNLEQARDRLLDRIEELESMKARLRPEADR